MSRSALVLSTVGLTAAALVTSTVVATSATAKTPVGRSSVRFHTSRSFHAVAPKSVRPGIAHLRTTGHSIALVVEAKHGTGSAKQAAAGLRATNPHKLLDHYRFVAFLLPGKGVYTRLTRGTYYIAAGPLKASKMARMTVTGSRVDAKLPKSRSIVEDSHKSLHTPYSIPRRGWLHVMNRSSAFSNMFVFGVASKATYRTLQDLVAHPTFKKLSEVIAAGSGFTFVDADSHSSTWMHFAGRPGRYVAAVVPVRGNGSRTGLHRGQVRIVHVK